MVSVQECQKGWGVPDLEQSAHHRENHPPIITTSDKRGGAVLGDYIHGLISGDLTQAAVAEAVRIEPYLDALGVRTNFGRSAGHPVLKTIRNIITYRSLSADHSTDKKLAPSEKGWMKDLFTKAADDTGNVITSEFAILPMNFHRFDEIIYLASRRKIKGFHKVVEHSGTSTRVDLIQCLHGVGEGSVSFPALGLDPDVLKLIEGTDSTAALQGLQEIFTAANHDMLHHLTSSSVHESVANHAKTPSYSDEMYNFIESYCHNNKEGMVHPRSYESWLLLSHAATWREMKGTQTEFSLQASVDRFFDALSDLDRDMESLGRTSAERHKVIDYFSTLGGFALMRIYGFNDPLMKEALGRMESLSLQPAKIIEDSGLCPLLSNMEKRREIYNDFVNESAFLTGGHLYRAGKAISYHNARIEKDRPVFEVPRLRKHLVDNGSMDVSLTPEEATEIAKELQSFANFVASGSVGEEAQRYFERIMLETVTDAFHKNAKYTAPYRDLLPVAFQDYIHTMEEGLEPSRDFSARLKIKDRESDDSMLDKTLINYALSGHSLLDMERDSPYIVAKRLQIIKMAPEIAFLASPEESNPALVKLHKNAEALDEGIIGILGKTL